MNQNNLPITIQSLPQSQQALESSLQSLIKSYLRRQQWKNYLFSNASPNQRTPPQWRTELADFLESKRAHAITILLLLVDLTLTTLELTSSLLSCNPSKQGEKRQENRKTTPWFHWLGMAILGLLLARTAALAAALGWPAVLRRPGLAVDGAVLAGALLLEAFLERRGGGLVAVASLWRVVRVVESAFELSDDAIEAQIEGLREENRRLIEVVDEKGKVIEKLQEDLDRCRDYCSCLEHV